MDSIGLIDFIQNIVIQYFQRFQMIKPAVIGTLVVLILYNFFGITLILGLLSIALVLLGLIYLNQNKILYMPVIPGSSQSPGTNPTGWQHPREQGCQAENIEILTSDNIKLRGWFIQNEANDKLIIYFHENAGNLGMRIPYIKTMHQSTAANVLLMAYRGYSDSQGTPSEVGLQRDGEAVLEWAVNYKNRKIKEGFFMSVFVLGRSLGGAVTLYVSTHKKFEKQISGIILENTFTNIKDMVECIFPFLAYFPFLRTNHWESLERIKRVDLPILFIRSMKDEIVPTHQMGTLISNAKNSSLKIQYQIINGTHNESWQYEPEVYFEKIYSFLQKVDSKDQKDQPKSQ